MNSEKAKIFIYSGNIHSGKTTKIFEWSKTQNSVDGILAPVIYSKRNLYRIKTKEIHLLESDDLKEEKTIISIGNYKFKKDIFQWAQNELLRALELKPEWLIIDEIGYLELSSKGLEPAVSEILKDIYKYSTKIILIVRENLIDKVIEFYKLNLSEYSYFKI